MYVTRVLLLCLCIFSAQAVADDGPPQYQCGVPIVAPSNIHGRIVGGREATPHSWPWMVDVQLYTTHYCGAAIINSKWMVSAAHCFSYAFASYKAVVGNHLQYLIEPNESSLQIEYVYIHEGYTNADGYERNDIALIRLWKEIEMNDHVIPVCLPDQGQDWPVDTECYATGWGDTRGTGDPDELNQVYVPIIDHDTCNQRHWYDNVISDTMLCAGHRRGEKDSCTADSGGPLMCDVNGTWVLAGVTSWGDDCAVAYKPGVYTHVSRFRDWIEDTMRARDQ